MTHSHYSGAVKRLKERIYDQHLTSGHIAEYEPLRDHALDDYFQTPHMQKHLHKLGLVSYSANVYEEATSLTF